MMITDERIEQLRSSWAEETNDQATEEWREELTPEEAALVDEWDEACPL